MYSFIIVANQLHTVLKFFMTKFTSQMFFFGMGTLMHLKITFILTDAIAQGAFPDCRSNRISVYVLLKVTCITECSGSLPRLMTCFCSWLCNCFPHSSHICCVSVYTYQVFLRLLGLAKHNSQSLHFNFLSFERKCELTSCIVLNTLSHYTHLNFHLGTGLSFLGLYNVNFLIINVPFLSNVGGNGSSVLVGIASSMTSVGGSYISVASVSLPVELSSASASDDIVALTPGRLWLGGGGSSPFFVTLMNFWAASL